MKVSFWGPGLAHYCLGLQYPPNSLTPGSGYWIMATPYLPVGQSTDGFVAKYSIRRGPVLERGSLVPCSLSLCFLAAVGWTAFLNCAFHCALFALKPGIEQE